MSKLRRTSRKGQGLVEYALILALVSLIAIVILAIAGKTIANTFCDVVIQLGGSAPDWVQACRAPRVTLVGNMTSDPVNIEAIVKNNHGQMTSGVDVVFSVDGNPRTPEHAYRYCLGGGYVTGAPCNSLHVGNGQHVIRAVATDLTTGLTGEASITINVS